MTARRCTRFRGWARRALALPSLSFQEICNAFRFDPARRPGDRPLPEARRRDGCRLRRRQGGHGRKRAQGRSRNRCARRVGLHRHPGPDRSAHPCLLGRHLARHRRRGVLPHLRRHHGGRHRQRRPGQFRGLPQARDRAEPGPHSRLSACLARRHLRLLASGHGRRERGDPADESDRRRHGGGAEPRPHRRHQGAGRPPRLGHLGDRAARHRA